MIVFLFLTWNVWVHPIGQAREGDGELRCLIQELKIYHRLFLRYSQMSVRQLVIPLGLLMLQLRELEFIVFNDFVCFCQTIDMSVWFNWLRKNVTSCNIIFKVCLKVFMTKTPTQRRCCYANKNLEQKKSLDCKLVFLSKHHPVQLTGISCTIAPVSHYVSN